MGTEVIDESADVCLHFSGHVTSQAFERVLNFCWNSCCMYFSLYTLGAWTNRLLYGKYVKSI